MGMQQNRRRLFVKGLGQLEVRETDPSPATEFVNAGFLKAAQINDVYNMVEIVGDTGRLLNFLPQDQKVSGIFDLWQTSKEELDLLRNAAAKQHAIRYSGLATPTVHQTWVFPMARLDPSISLAYKPGERTLAVKFAALNQQGIGYELPEYYLLERDAEILITGQHLWVDARELLNTGAGQLVDFSGFERHGTVLPANRYANIWQVSAAPYFLRFDGTQDYVGHGNILNDDGSGDFVVEAWLRIQESNGTAVELITKKAAFVDNTAGWALYRTVTTNTVSFRIGSGGASAVVVSAGTLLQNVWNHVLVAIDRNGNGQIYLNGSASGSAVSVAAIGTGTNALDTYLGRCGTGYGQIDIGGTRIYRWVAGGLPANIATVAATHYNAEKTYYGL